MNLDREYKTALQNCKSDLIRMSEDRACRGMESVYGTELMGVLANSRQCTKVCDEVPLENIGGQAVDGRRNGRVDIVVEGRNSNVHAIELKVVKLPREEHLGPNECLWDIGQITGDFLRLESANRLTSFDCVIVLHGVLMSVYRTNRKLLREFHNRMFVDFKTSEMDGELNKEKNDPFRRKQVRLIHQLGLDLPFTPSTKLMRALTSKELGLITISGPLP